MTQTLKQILTNPNRQDQAEESEEYKKGYTDGHAKGVEEGHEKGYADGHKKGFNEGYNKSSEDAGVHGIRSDGTLR